MDLKYIGRWTDGARDHDLFAYSALDFGNPDEHRVTGNLSGRVAWDMDRDRDPTHPFRSVEDSYSGDVTARLYSAYVDLNGTAADPVVGVARRVRIGRHVQSASLKVMYLDGISLDTLPARDWGDLDLSIHAGVPSHLFESSPSGDIAGGATIRCAPWTDARLRVGYMHVTDDYLSSSRDDDLIGFGLDQRIGKKLFVNAFANAFDFEQLSDLGVSGSWVDADADFNLTARYTGLANDEKRRSIDFDYYTEILADFAAFDQFEVTIHKGIGESLYLEGGAQFRELRHDSKESLFNHEFRRYHALIGTTEWPWHGADVSATYEIWEASGERFSSFGADFTQGFGTSWAGSIGTFFELFRYDPARGTENEDVQVSYLKLTHKLSKGKRLRVHAAYENGERDEFYTLTLSMQIDF